MNEQTQAPQGLSPYVSVRWQGDTLGQLELLDQTILPDRVEMVPIRSVQEAHEAIVALRVRGAPAIGIAAAYAVVTGMQSLVSRRASIGESLEHAKSLCDYLATSRPTAVNLFWALDRMRRIIDRNSNLASALELSNLLTHCNTGGLATSEFGTALAAILTAHYQGKEIEVYADETRPLLQGARLTMWELQQHGVPSTLICDSMAAQVMREGKIQYVIVGADRITARGDTANKIGTYGLAVLAKHHGVPFFVAAPSSTFDLSILDGADIPIEQRKPEEITLAFGKRTAPENVRVYNPAFDVTPAELISAIITEVGIIHPVDEQHVRGIVRQ